VRPGRSSRSAGVTSGVQPPCSGGFELCNPRPPPQPSWWSRCSGLAEKLSRCPDCLPTCTLCMPALAGYGQTATHAFAVWAAILVAFLYRAFAPWMRALRSFLFGHDIPLSSVVISTPDSQTQGPIHVPSPSLTDCGILFSCEVRGHGQSNFTLRSPDFLPSCSPTLGCSAVDEPSKRALNVPCYSLGVASFCEPDGASGCSQFFASPQQRPSPIPLICSHLKTWKTRTRTGSVVNGQQTF
jgi:hypothetical protein